MQTFLLLTMCLLPAFFPQAKADKSDLRVVYDRVEDRTNVSTKPKDITGNMQLLAYFNHGGKTITKPINSVGLLIDSYSREWKFLKPEEQILYVLADEARFKFESPARHSNLTQSRSRYSSNNVHERLIFSLSPQELARIARAHTVEMKLGSQTFTLKEDVLRSLREILVAAESLR